MFTKLKSGKKGFTLIELLVVISIIGMLAGIVLVSMTGIRGKARDARRVQDLRALGVATMLYYDSKESFPDNATTASGDWDSNFKAQLGPYLKPPIDPLRNDGGYYYGAYRMTWAPDANCNGRYVFWTYLESSGSPNYGKYTCGFGGSHYFVVLDKY
jgi:prepilin-type N-terminal cleavage/methylation domain-containing protein